jgi:hypothetical protein
VAPPGSPDFPRTALSWLYDHCPPDLRGYPVLHRQPVALASIAARHQAAAALALREGFATARAELGEVLGDPALTEVLAIFPQEAERAEAAARAATLIGQALRGRRWVRRL